MVASYAQSSPLKAALLRHSTANIPARFANLFSGKSPSKNRKSKKLLTKLDFFLAATPACLFPPVPDTLHFTPPPSAGARDETPPTPRLERSAG